MSKITLRAARINAGFTQVEVAEKTGYAVSTIRNWEQGKSYPKQPAITVLCELYGVSYDNINFDI